MEKENEDGLRAQAGWNIVSQHSGMVLEQLQLAGRYYAEGIVDKWFWSLSACRELVNHDLKTEEKTELDNMEKFIKKGIIYWDKQQYKISNYEKVDKRLQNNAKVFTNKIMKYQRRLMQLLKLQGYFPKKKNREELNF